MAFKITEECSGCGLCPDECPNDAITEGEDIYEINQDKCMECEGQFDTQQCAEVCPSDACISSEQ